MLCQLLPNCRVGKIGLKKRSCVCRSRRMSLCQVNGKCSRSSCLCVTKCPLRVQSLAGARWRYLGRDAEAAERPASSYTSYTSHHILASLLCNRTSNWEAEERTRIRDARGKHFGWLCRGGGGGGRGKNCLGLRSLLPGEGGASSFYASVSPPGRPAHPGSPTLTWQQIIHRGKT